MHSRILLRMAKPNPLDQLRSLNEIFARAGSSNAEQAEHARKAIDFYGSEQKNNADCNPSLESGAATLAQLHLGQASTSEVAYCHWHIPGTESTSPLWIRQAIVAEMKENMFSRQKKRHRKRIEQYLFPNSVPGHGAPKLACLSNYVIFLLALIIFRNCADRVLI